MATFAQANKKKNNSTGSKPVKLSVGHAQILDSVSIDLDAIARERWLMTILNGDQFGFQIQQHPLRLDSPRGLIVWFVDEKGKPVSTKEPEPADTDEDTGETYDEDMSIMDGADVVTMLNQYIGEGDIEVVEGKFPPLVRIVTAPVNPDMLT